MNPLWTGPAVVPEKSIPPMRRAARAAAVFGLLIMLCACSARVTPSALRTDLVANRLAQITGQVEDGYGPGDDFHTSLTLGRLYQMRGQWAKSMAAYDDALAILREYEQRAVINIRALGAEAGMFTLARSAKGYFGAGYERSLLHTFNALNYLMLNRLSGGAVEMRKMEVRQERWLRESEELLKKALKEAPGQELTPDDLPGGYSMRGILAGTDGRRVASTYQDAFSYALSALICRLAGDPAHADVSRKRALALEPGAAPLFLPEHGAPYATADPQKEEPPASLDVLVVATTGLGPSLYLERVRTPVPGIGYVTLDMPAYLPALCNEPEPRLRLNGRERPLIPLLFTQALAHRTLWDSIRHETTAAYTRAGIKTAAATTALVLAYCHEDLRPYAGIIGAMVTFLADMGTEALEEHVRNWDTLPCLGALARFRASPGDTLVVETGGGERELSLPREGNAVIVWINALSPQHIRIDHAAF